ncbi:T9SS type B sorting domain-containing protein [Flaviaesturariibacter flavus]|uniref:T9SS type B sorting domain-containing protein n=1 Tax=Flaviaesturariibacter flavus TaxID=2502780 RepID=A0A4R1BCD1_9BACT|nr:T9SS type B sorting domain-containing protein [Flaviaesturariibacter flavus]TCJ14608.1 T9SS type B sorting domain-containing protein [Flaviaesturariibacter flavus]
MTTVNGACTDTAVLHLTINQGVRSDTTATACGTYSWRGTTYTASGNYTVTTVNGACTDTAVLHLTVNNFGSRRDTTVASCSDITWYGQTYTTSGDYNHITSATGCPDTVTLHLTITGPTLRITDPALTCNQPTVDLTDPAITAGSTPGLTYTYWTNPQATQPHPNPRAVSSSSTCFIKGAGAGGCHRVSPVRVRISNMLVTASTQNVNCSDNGGSITVNADNGIPPYRYSLGGGTYQASRTFSNLPPGQYTVFVQDGGGCTTQVAVTIEATPNARIEGGSTRCSGGTDTLRIHFTGIAPWSITYREGSILRTISGITATPYLLVVSPVSTTQYTLVSVSDIKCTNSNLVSSALVTIAPAVSGMRYPTEAAAPNTPKQLLARNLGPGCQYLWTPPTGLDISTIYNPVFRHNQQQEFLIRITNGSGCVTVDTVLVQMRTTTTQSIYSDIFVPKAWTPNNDGHNDRLYPLTVHIEELYYFRIFNRWGQLMFETSTIGFGWDGIYKGQPQVSDTYTWTLEARGEDGKYYKRAGNSVLLR